MNTKKKAFKKENVQAAVWQDTDESSPLVLEHAGNWIDEGKYQHRECILKETATGNFYRYWHARSGSYFSDYTYSFEWEKDETKLAQVIKGTKVIEAWYAVPEEDPCS